MIIIEEYVDDYVDDWDGESRGDQDNNEVVSVKFVEQVRVVRPLRTTTPAPHEVGIGLEEVVVESTSESRSNYRADIFAQQGGGGEWTFDNYYYDDATISTSTTLQKILPVNLTTTGATSNGRRRRSSSRSSRSSSKRRRKQNPNALDYIPLKPYALNIIYGLGPKETIPSEPAGTTNHHHHHHHQQQRQQQLPPLPPLPPPPPNNIANANNNQKPTSNSCIKIKGRIRCSNDDATSMPPILSEPAGTTNHHQQQQQQLPPLPPPPLPPPNNISNANNYQKPTSNSCNKIKGRITCSNDDAKSMPTTTSNNPPSPVPHHCPQERKVVSTPSPTVTTAPAVQSDSQQEIILKATVSSPARASATATETLRRAVKKDLLNRKEGSDINKDVTIIEKKNGEDEYPSLVMSRTSTEDDDSTDSNSTPVLPAGLTARASMRLSLVTARLRQRLNEHTKKKKTKKLEGQQQQQRSSKKTTPTRQCKNNVALELEGTKKKKENVTRRRRNSNWEVIFRAIGTAQKSLRQQLKKCAKKRKKKNLEGQQQLVSSNRKTKTTRQNNNRIAPELEEREKQEEEVTEEVTERSSNWEEIFGAIGAGRQSLRQLPKSQRRDSSTWVNDDHPYMRELKEVQTDVLPMWRKETYDYWI